MVHHLSAYLPGLLLGGVEGKMLQPLGLTALFALAAAFPASLVLVPILCLLITRAPPNSAFGLAVTRGPELSKKRLLSDREAQV